MEESDPNTDLESLIREWREAQRKFELAVIESPGPMTTAYQRGMARKRAWNATSRLVEMAKARGHDATGLRRLAHLLQSPLDVQALVLDPPKQDDWLVAALEVDQLADAATPQDVTDQISEPEAVQDQTGYLSARQLADLYGVEYDPLRRRLERFQKKNGDGWTEVANRKVRSAQYLFDPQAVKPIIDDLKKKKSVR